MGRWRGADGRSDPPAISRTRGGLGAVGLGGRLGSGGAVAGRPVLVVRAGDCVALDVCHRRPAGSPGILSSTLRHGAGDRRRHPHQTGRRRRPASAVGNFRRPDPQDHHSRLADGNGLPGRLLRHHLLGAALPNHRTPPLYRQLHRLSRGADHRVICRLSRRRLACRPHWTAQPVPDLLAWRDRGGPAVYATAADQ